MSTLHRISTAFLCATAVLWADRGQAQGLSDSLRVRRFHVGVTIVGVRHLGGQGLGLFGIYGNWERPATFIAWGGETLLYHSGERRIRREKAYNRYFSSDTTIVIVYEQISMIGVGGSAFSVIHAQPEEYGWHLPGVAIGLSAGLMIETDRVGLRSSDVDLYYGYGNSDTDFSLRPYVRPQLLVSQGSISVVGGVAFFPVFATWSVGIAYGW